MQPTSRRRFLIGGAAAGALAIGGVGCEAVTNVHGTRRFLHRSGLLGGPDEKPPQVSPEVDYGSLAGPRGSVNYGLSMPAMSVSAVLYCLHGRGGSRRDAFDSIGVHRFVAARDLPWAVASLDGGEGFWHRRRDGSDTQRDVVEVLMPFVATKAPGAKAVLIGWSMGGYGALLIPWKRPDLFAAAVANGPSIWPSLADANAGAFDDDADFHQNDVLANASALGSTPFRIDCGDDDPFADAVGRLRAAAPALDVHVSAGFHEDATWRSFLPAQLDFVQSHVGT